MATKQSCNKCRWVSGNKFAAGLLLAALAAGALPARAGVPEWLRAAAREPLPTYAADTPAVLLFEEQITTVKENGDIKTVRRRAYKILRPEGRSYGIFAIYFSPDTRLSYMKAWSLPALGKEYEVKEKDAVETSAFGVAVYEDTRYKVLTIPAAEPGNIVGYEYEQKQRPYILQETWYVQRAKIPVRRSRFVLELPGGWEFETYWRNHPGQEPRAQGENRWLWEVENMPAVEPEPSMPPWEAVAGHLVVTLYPPRASLQEKSHRNWEEVGRWHWQLAAGRDQASPEIQQKVKELTAEAPMLVEKMRALAAFVQREIRYVAVLVGISGWQSNPAPAIYQNRYGDCKDKATLLRTMLREIGVDSYYVSINTDRGVVIPEGPPALSFDHRILALRLPEDVPTTNLYAVLEHERLGRLLFFDPTSRYTPLGQLPPSLQENYGLVWAENVGELVKLPLQPPTTNRLLRMGKLTLTPAGTLQGQVQEVRWGAPAAERRAALLSATEKDRTKVLEDFLSGFLAGGFRLESAEVENLEQLDSTLILRYRFTASNYAKQAGDLLLLRPRVLGQKSEDIMEQKEKDKQRKYPVEFDDAELHSDVFEITLPSEYRVDALPAPLAIDYGFANYKSEIEVEGNLLRYKRHFSITDVRVPSERLADLKKFYRQVAGDERASVVLKRARP